MNQSPPRVRTVRNAPPPLVRPRNSRRNLIARAQEARIIHPPILGAPLFNQNNSNAATIALPNANRLRNFNSNSNSNSNNMKMPATKRRRLNNNKKNKNTKKTARINIHKVSKNN
jgi:hypothetical protein